MGLAGKLQTFWQRVETTDQRLVIWFGRHCESELAFFLNWTETLGDRPYDIVDVTRQEFPSVRLGPGVLPTWPAKWKIGRKGARALLPELRAEPAGRR